MVVMDKKKSKAALKMGAAGSRSSSEVQGGVGGVGYLPRSKSLIGCAFFT